MNFCFLFFLLLLVLLIPINPEGDCVMGSPTPSHHTTGSVGGSGGVGGGAAAMKNWTEQDLEQALDALRQKTMSLTRASAHFGIPSTTLWQRAHRAGVSAEIFFHPFISTRRRVCFRCPRSVAVIFSF